MKIYVVTAAFFLSVLNASAQGLSISGVISNKDGKPVRGAVVVLAGQDIRDTTDDTGAYSIKSDEVATGSSPAKTPVERISFDNGMVSVNTSKTAHVRIEAFDVTGRLLEPAIVQQLASGGYRFDCRSFARLAQVMVIRVATGRESATFRYVPFNRGGSAAAASAVFSGAGARFTAGKQNLIDSLVVTARSFVTKTAGVSSYQDTVNITLDTIDLPHFSFFVTSLAAIRDLGGPDGFGGDLRFGRTGPGAGLRGADSLCECIAERSMPGSAVKIWKAFLSASTNEKGEDIQVNAVERVGTGPWYDRIGRLLASTTGDLLNKRPQNGDEDIRNDLPNEDGVPNHRPDPTTNEAIDNHRVMTGSGEDGRLYAENATCDDWTSVTADDRPRMGYSWPRAWAVGNDEGKNWISGWDGPGCEAGIDIDTRTLFGKDGDKFVGSGGGYGAIYCFALNP